MRKATAGEIFEALKKLKEDGPIYLNSGICCNLNGILRELSLGFPDESLRAAFKTWPHFSGDACYPLDGEEDYYSEQAYWKNKKRLKLLDYLIEYFDEPGHDQSEDHATET